MPLVSILMPAFNAERWIADSIESALAQTWLRTECGDNRILFSQRGNRETYVEKSLRVEAQAGRPNAFRVAYNFGNKRLRAA